MNQLGQRSKLYELSEMALLFVTGLYVFVVDITKTTMKVEIPDHWERYLIMLIAPVAAIRLTLFLIEEKDREQRKKWLQYILVGLLIAAVYYMVFREGKYKTAAFLAVFTIGTIGMDYIKILKAYIVAATTVIFSAILMAWSGVIENFVFFREYTLRSSWGIKYPTDLTSLLFFLILACWVVFRKESSIQFIIPGCLLFVIAYFITDSRTGILCSIALIITIILDLMLSKSDNTILHKIISIAACVAFPAFTVITNALVLAYKSGFPLMTEVNELSSNRLALSVNALNEHGIHLFGSKVEQVGWGGSTFDKPDYNFIDISYVYLLIAYGVVALIMINILWVLMTRKAIKTGDRRLALALALIAFNSATEHHINQINYNIFLAVPFAVMAVKYTKKEATDSTERNVIAGKEIGTTIKKAVLALSVLLLVALAIWVSLPAGRTIITLIDTNETVSGRRQLLIIYALITWLIIATAYACYKVCKYLIIDKSTTAIKAWTAILLLFAVVCISGTIRGSAFIKNGEKENGDLIESERPVIETVLNAGRGKLYACGLPSIYRDKFKKISTSLFNGEELARFDDATIIIDKNTDSPSLFKKGFLYTQISDEHALFTKDEKVIEALSEIGQHFTGYFPLIMTVDMKDMAERNGLSQNSDGSITLHGEDEKLRKGPRIGLREGRYTIIFNLELEEPKATNGKDAVCRLKTTYYKGEYILDETYVIGEEFDEKGHCNAKVVCDIPDAANVDFKVLPEGDNAIKVIGITYQKTPKYDVHSFYNQEGNKYREEYFDMKGNPYSGSWEYFAKEMLYDEKGNNTEESYFDEKGNKVPNSSGIHRWKRTFDDKNMVVKDEYFGVSDERVAIETGQSIAEFKYDNLNRQTEATFYDKDDNAILIGGEDWGGYHKIKREFDADGRIIREDFYDTAGSLVIRKEGYSTRTYGYDENDNRTEEKYFDVKGNKTYNSDGVSEIRRIYNEEDRTIRESCYDVYGKEVNAKTGQASTLYDYDRDRVTTVSYINTEGQPIIYKNKKEGGYSKVVMVYDEYDRIIREEYYDTLNRPILVNEGYASKEMTYADYDDTPIEYKYYDTEKREIHIDISEEAAA